MFTSRQLTPEYKEVLISWVTSRKSLTRVSGDNKDKLTYEILESWLNKSIHHIVIVDENQYIVGFCTLENIREGEIEICHLLVKPRNRKYIEIGCYIINEAIKFSEMKSYKLVWGRSIKNNKFTSTLGKYNRFAKILYIPLYLDNSFDWYKLQLNQ